MMNRIKNFFVRHLLALPISLTAWFYLLLNTSVGFFGATGAMIGAYAGTLFVSKQVQISRTAKRFGLSRGEYRAIVDQLDQARAKLRELNTSYAQVRNVHSFRQLHELNQLAKRIIQIVEKNPRKFYHVDSFFYAHLESAVDITSKYTMLSNQPLQDSEIKHALITTKEKLTTVKELLESDLKRAVATDVEKLKIELDYIDVAHQQHLPKPPEEDAK